MPALAECSGVGWRRERPARELEEVLCCKIGVGGDLDCLDAEFTDRPHLNLLLQILHLIALQHVSQLPQLRHVTCIPHVQHVKIKSGERASGSQSVDLRGRVRAGWGAVGGNLLKR